MRGVSWRRSLVGFWLGLSLLVGGCGADTVESVGVVRQAIEGGAPDTEHIGVFRILLRSDGVNGLCTGTLIAPNLVLTARHCVSQSAQRVRCGEAPLGTPYPIDHFLLANDLEPTLTSNWHSVAEVRIPEGGSDICGFDVALVILESDVPASEAIPTTPRLDSPLADGEAYTAVGYGFNGDENDPNAFGIRLVLEDLSVACEAGTCPGGVASNEFTGETGVCGGDSGGPALDSEGRVAGVVSRGTDPCETPVYGDVSSWSDWIREVATDAADLSSAPAPAWLTGVDSNMDAPPAAEPNSDVLGDESGCNSIAGSQRRSGGPLGVLLAVVALGAGVLRRRSRQAR